MSLKMKMYIGFLSNLWSLLSWLLSAGSLSPQTLWLSLYLLMISMIVSHLLFSRALKISRSSKVGEGEFSPMKIPKLKSVPAHIDVPPLPTPTTMIVLAVLGAISPMVWKPLLLKSICWRVIFVSSKMEREVYHAIGGVNRNILCFRSCWIVCSAFLSILVFCGMNS